VLGRVRVVYPIHFEAEATRLPKRELQHEGERLERALQRAAQELAALTTRLSSALKRELGDLLDAHAALLADTELARELKERVRRDHLSAEAALAAQRTHLAELFAQVEDPYLQSRREDLEQVLARVYAALRRGEAAPRRAGGGATILVAESLAPAELAHAHEQGLVAIVLRGGSPHGHAAIMARSFKLPMVVQCPDALAALGDGELALVDGDAGTVTAQPDALDLARLRTHNTEQEQRARRRSRLRHAESKTADGAVITLYVNADDPEKIAEARRLGANGVGLYRSETMFLAGGPTAEDQQYRAYRDAILAMAGRPVTLRTLDLGADKAGPLGREREPEGNPALGLRGIRLSLALPDLFAAQVRAMLRASAYGPVRILLPMLTDAGEVRAAQSMIESCRAELRAQRIGQGELVQVGGMIETPAAALRARDLLQGLDFVAIGSNDLTQYTLAADRNHAGLAHVYDPLHPAVLQLIAQTVDAAQRARKPCVLCGELAADTRALPALLALGLTQLSVHPDALLEVRETLLLHSRKKLRSRRAKLLAARDADEIAEALKD